MPSSWYAFSFLFPVFAGANGEGAAEEPKIRPATRQLGRWSEEYDVYCQPDTEKQEDPVPVLIQLPRPTGIHVVALLRVPL